MLEQLEQLVPALEDAYAQPIEAIGNSSIGDHIRHLIEFYGCLFSGLEKTSEVDYEGRKRNQDLAQFPAVALSAIAELKQALHRPLLERELQVQGMLSSVGRELQYAFDHAIHHCALIKAGLYILQKKHLVTEDFGVSPSTVRYRERQALMSS